MAAAVVSQRVEVAARRVEWAAGVLGRGWRGRRAARRAGMATALQGAARGWLLRRRLGGHRGLGSSRRGRSRDGGRRCVRLSDGRPVVGRLVATRRMQALWRGRMGRR
jgi:hypothetical protein